MARKESTHTRAWLVPVIFFGFGAFVAMSSFVSLALLANVFALLAVGIFCARRPPLPPKPLLFAILTCALIAFFIGAAPGIGEVRRLNSLRDEFPVLSIRDRLQYEQRSQLVHKVSNSMIDPFVLKRLTDAEAEISRNSYRSREFKMLHQYSYDLFVRSIGFGIGRMMMPDIEDLRKPPLRNIKFNENELVNSDGPFIPWELKFEYRDSPSPEGLHELSRFDFLHPDSFGAIVEPKTTAIGFIPHAIHHSPIDGLKNKSHWTIERLELVSLLKFDEPRVYVLDHMPRMDQLSSSNVPTRPLDDFEKTALEKLSTQQDIVVENTGAKYRMLGSLRAATQCADCHNVDRGALLGAFSYALAADLEPAQ